MASVDCKLKWILHLESSEFNLVMKALGGRLTPEEVDRAKDLGLDFSTRKVIQIKPAG